MLLYVPPLLHVHESAQSFVSLSGFVVVVTLFVINLRGSSVH